MPVLLVRLAGRGGGPLHRARPGGGVAGVGPLVNTRFAADEHEHEHGNRQRWRGARSVVLVVLLLCGTIAFAQERPPDPADLINAVLGGLLGFKEVSGAELQEEVAEVGGVPFRTPVPLDYL